MRSPVQNPKSWLDRFKNDYIYFLGVFAVIVSFLVGGLVFLHFQLGWDLWFFKVNHVETAQYWGQIGDFIGGILNPLLSFCALMAVLYNLSLQREELALARKDAREAQRIQSNQSVIFETQNFESVFFRLLDVHSRIAGAVRASKKAVGGVARLGDEAFSFASRRYYHTALMHAHSSLDSEGRTRIVKEAAQKFIDEEVQGFGHYYRNLYQILKYVDGLGHTAASASSKNPVGMEIRRTVRLYRKQRDYANILRAQLSEDEVACLYLNCLSEQGKGLKYYVEKYSMLKTIGEEVRDDAVMRELYSGVAYADYEEMEMSELISLIVAKYQNDPPPVSVMY